MPRQRLLLVAGILAFTAIFHVAYVARISPAFSYLSYEYVPLDVLDFVIVVVLVLVPLSFLPIRIRRPSQFLVWLLYIFVHIPTAMMFAYLSGTASRFLGFNLLVILSLATLSYVGSLPSLRLPRHELSAAGFTVLVLVLAAAANALIITRFGFVFDLPAFSEVYSVRGIFADNIAATGRSINYLTNWQGNVLNPLLLGIGYHRRSPVIIAVAIVSQLYLYSLSGRKLLILGPVILVVIIAWAMRKNGRRFANRLVALVVGGSALALASDYVFDSIQGTSLIIRRGLVISGLNTFRYVEFFTSHPPALLAHSVLKGLVPANYEEVPKAAIAAFYGGTLGPNANLFADAFANFRYFGFLLLIGAFILLLRFVDSASAGRPMSLVLLALGVPMFAFTQTAFLTTLLTHGGLLAILLLFVMPSEVAWSVSTRKWGNQNQHKEPDVQNPTSSTSAAEGGPPSL